MKKLFVLLTALFTLTQVNAQEKNVIRIATDNTDLILQVAPNGRLYQAYLGDKLLNEKDINNFSPYVKGGSDGSVSTRGWEVYPGSGAEDYFEPAVAITHNDGNPSTILRYVSSEQKAVAGGTETVIQLKDDQYPVEVTLHYIAYPKENVIKTWSEIKHAEKKPVTIWRYASTMLYFSGNEYYLTPAFTFGNVHGAYKPGVVKLRPSLLGDIQARVARAVGLIKIIRKYFNLKFS